MVAEPHINGWTQITVWYSDAGGQHSNVFNYKSATQPGPGEMSGIASNFWSLVGTAYKAIMTAQHNIDKIEARTRWVGVNYFGVFYPTQPQPGTVAGDGLPNNAASVISWKSGARGRSFNGRTYMGGLGEGQVTLDTASSTLLTNLQTLANLIATFTNITGTPMTFVVASVKLLQLVPILKDVIDNIIDSQRRRLTGRGQ